MLTAYFDASYNQPKGKTISEPPVHTVGVYVGHVDDWARLRRAWDDALKKHNVDHFHMVDFDHVRRMVESADTQKRISSKSFYKGWSPKELDSFLKRLHRILGRKKADGSPRLQGFISNIVKNDYDKTLPDDLKDDPRCASYYIANVSNLMETVAEWAIQNKYEGYIHYVFAGGDGEDGNLERLFARLFERAITIKHFHLGRGFTGKGYDIEWMKAEPALQAVDCVAYEFNKQIVEWVKNDYSPILEPDMRPSILSLCRANYWGYTLREPDLKLLFTDVRRINIQHGFAMP